MQKKIYATFLIAQLTVLASHSDTVLSAELETKVLENGRNATLLTESVCPLSVVRQRRLSKNMNKTKNVII